MSQNSSDDVNHLGRRGRRSIRLEGYEYTQPGAYFVTVCAHEHKCLFGNVTDGEMAVNDWGRIVDYCWRRISYHFPDTDLDEFIIMPNHLHGIIWIFEDSIVGAKHPTKGKWKACENAADDASPLRYETDKEISHPKGTRAGSLSAMIQNFSSVTTRKINRIRKTPGQHLWQRNFYEHIIRDDDDLNRIRKYIRFNAAKWEEDEYFR